MFENKPFIQPIKVTTYDFILKKKLSMDFRSAS